MPNLTVASWRARIIITSPNAFALSVSLSLIPMNIHSFNRLLTPAAVAPVALNFLGNPEMNPANYKAQRELRGTQASVAALLGVNRVTIARRETGEQVITTEAWMALKALPKPRKNQSCTGLAASARCCATTPAEPLDAAFTSAAAC